MNLMDYNIAMTKKWMSATHITRDESYKHHGEWKKQYTKENDRDFPGGAVVKNPPANAGDKGSSPRPGRSHIPQSN